MEPNVVTSQVTTAALVAFVLQWAKRSPWCPWLQADDKRVQFYLSGVLALATSLGIAYTWNADTGTLVITGLSWSTIGPAAWDWIRQWVMQQAVYQGVVQRGQVRAKEVVVVDRSATKEDVQRALATALEQVYQQEGGAA